MKSPGGSPEKNIKKKKHEEHFWRKTLEVLLKEHVRRYFRRTLPRKSCRDTPRNAPRGTHRKVLLEKHFLRNL